MLANFCDANRIQTKNYLVVSCLHTKGHSQNLEYAFVPNDIKMDISLDDYIRSKKGANQMDVSLDEYITMNNIVKPTTQQNQNHQNQTQSQSQSGLSKFDRYKHQDDDGDDGADMDDDGLPKEMPKLVPFVPKKMPPKAKSVHDRLGKRGSVSSIPSIHTSQLKLFRPTFKAKQSVQSRLGRGFVNAAVVERNRIAVHALNTYAKSAAKNIMATDDVQGQILINAFTKAIQMESPPQKKYDMKIQKEISMLQGKQLHYTCPGAYVISNDGPGIRGATTVPNHSTDISMNQRFA